MIIEQQTNHDCGVAALAMATGYSYADVLSDLGTQARQIGVTSNEIVLYLWRIGHKSQYLMTKQAVQTCDPDADQRVTIEHTDLAAFLCSSRMSSILNVRCPGGGLHAVFFDGKRVLCPKRGVLEAPKYFKDYTIFEAVLLE